MTLSSKNAFRCYFSLCVVDQVLLLTQFKFNFIGGIEFSGKVLRVAKRKNSGESISSTSLLQKQLSTQP